MTRKAAETRRQFLGRSGALLAALAGRSLTSPAGVEARKPGDSLDLGLERARVRFELRLFERHYLPQFFAPFCLDHQRGGPRLVFCQEREQNLERWQAASHRLADLLAAPRQADRAAVKNDEFRRLFTMPCQQRDVDHSFMLDLPHHRCFSLYRARICWHVYPLGSIRPEPEGRAREAFALLNRCFDLSFPAATKTLDLCEQLRRLLPRIEELYRRLDPLDDAHFAAFEHLLPLLVETDPAWAVDALDRNWMEHQVRIDLHLSPRERELRLEQLSSLFVSSYLGSAHALVMQALANNHFGKIANLFGHPEIFGSANRLMTEVVFAVLYHKVKVLRCLFAWQEPAMPRC